MLDKIGTMLRQHVKPMYDTHDGGHQIDHADTVAEESLYVADQYGLPEKEIPLLYAAAFLHDVGIGIAGREQHHIGSYEYVKHNTGCVRLLNNWFSKSEQLTIAIACREHRASYKGAFTTDISMLLSCSDRGRPNIAHYMQRGIAYRITHFPELSRDENVKQTIEHITDKFSRNGYAAKRMSPFYKRIYRKELELFYDEVDKLYQPEKQ